MSRSIRHRLSFSLFATVLRSGVAYLTGLLIARALGPESYGTMVFLLGTAAAARQLLDPGASTAFFTLHAQQDRSRRFNRFYFVWLAAQLLLPLATIAILSDGAVHWLWRGEARVSVALAFVAAFAQMSVWATFAQMAEAKRLTRDAQTVALGAVLVHLMVAVAAWAFGWMSVEFVLLAVALEWAVATLVLSRWLRYRRAVPGEDRPRQLLSEFWVFCAPLLPYSAVGALYEFGDRWLLQTYGGSAHQGYYAAALQFGAIGALAGAAVINVFWKEMAEAHFQGRVDVVKDLHRRVTRGLFFVAAAASGFLLPWSAELVELTLGAEYRDGVTTFAVMLLYPVHQTLGQVNGTTAFATQSVRSYTVIGSIMMVFGVAATYFAVAPSTALLPGLGLASVGLAIKMVLIQIVSVNLVSYYLTAKLGITFDWVYQPAVAGASFAFGWLAYMGAHAFAGTWSAWLVAATAFVAYAGLQAGFLWVAPTLMGMTRDEIKVLAAALRLPR